MTTPKTSLLRSLPWMLLGSGAAYFVAWTPNVAIAAWIVPLLLTHASRRAPPWATLAVIFPLLVVVNFFVVHGAWHMGIDTELVFAAVMSLPLTFALLADRLLHQRLTPLLGTLVLPSLWVLFDWSYSHIYGIGDVLSPALTQFHVTPLIQLVSLTGIYGITFLLGWVASVGATVWDNPERVAEWKRPVAALGLTLLAVAVFGSARLAVVDHVTPTVRVASIVVPHERDYWESIVDRGTPRAEADQFRGELRELEDELFVQSERAADNGAKIMFWSESAAVMYPEREQQFLDRAARFAKEHGVYLQTASLVLRYDDPMIDNQVTLFTPEGEVGYTYLKTQTWYPTESDGVIHSYATPWGTLSSVICFDVDVPGWMRRVAQMDVDILLVPAFDTKQISPYHTEAGLFRAVEGGYSAIRGVNQGTSMAVDPMGRTLALQDFFRSDERIMYVDVSTQGTWTLYGTLGDWLPVGCLLVLLGLGLRVGVRAYRDRARRHD